jgi:hypothetical protein
MNLVHKLILVMVLIGFSSCGDPAPADPPADPPPAAPAVLVTVHVYSKPDGTVLWCPEELDPPPTTWDYNGTAEVDEDHEDVLTQCELE